ncbi:hypothetical protein CU097_009001 [Rhizopus azygosporus]|uniref:Secreted protein n=1 Tax=Rhizopus azygosporus TaxID=86630 RepID=A0A367J6T0_RHIAZ|nr:hypothetical protein CU097_009001 [Rhizopus azygosporus]
MNLFGVFVSFFLLFSNFEYIATTKYHRGALLTPLTTPSVSSPRGQRKKRLNYLHGNGKEDWPPESFVSSIQSYQHQPINFNY